ncbi:uroporphyrinogen-III synthase [Martiniozyma asiatica (nom. inval.)]|nr:uroporphyrinogen-III synthase [Martiniozyma asiatica]
MAPIVLLKNETVPEDTYRTAFTNETDSLHFIPLLNHTPINHAVIIDFLNSPEFKSYKAIIITSQRCIESLGLILETMKKLDNQKVQEITNMPAYTVGPATYKALADLGFSDIRGGDKAGNGNILADLMISDPLFNFQTADERKVLFLTGKIRKDIIPRKLIYAGFGFKELVAYKTESRDDILQIFDDVCTKLNNVNEKWLIFFSPQGTENIVEHVKHNCGSWKIAVIGPTTEQYLLENNITPHLVAKKPTAASLKEAIENFNK